MFDALDIIRRNARTYYSFRTQRPTRRWPAITIFFTTAIICAVVITRISPDFLAGALSAQSILVGFSFNALFYLVTNRLVTPKTWLFIEHEIRFKRLLKLSDELFDNISYFNLVAITSIAVNLALLLLDSEFLRVNALKGLVEGRLGTSIPIAGIKNAGLLVKGVLVGVLVFTTMEGLASFSRIIYRVRFYFSMLKIMHEDNATAEIEASQ